MSATIRLLTCDNIHGKNAKEFEYPGDIKGSQLLSLALKNLQIPEAKNLRLLIRKKDKEFKWVNPDKEISHYHPQDGMTIFVLRTSLAISVLTSDGTTKKLMIDISKTVKELVSFIAEKFRIGNAIGYSLFTISSDGEHVPLNLELSLPQQCTNYDKVVFKRRYFVFTKSQLMDPSSSMLAYNDVSEYLKKSSLTISDEKKAELCYYSLYITSADISQVTEESIPADTSEEVKALVIDFLKERKPPTKEESIGQYITISLSIPNFGSESFKCKYAIGEDKNYVPSELFVGPSKIDLLDGESKELLYSIPYFRYVSVHKSKGTVTIKFLLPDGQEQKLKIHHKNYTTIYAIISAYATFVKELGSELITDGFMKEESLNNAEEIDISNFTYYYTLSGAGKYLYYPGTLEPYQTKVVPLLPNYANEFPNEVNQIQEVLLKCMKNMFEQDSLLQLIYNTNEIIKKGKLPDNDKEEIINSLLMISTSNITVGNLEIILSNLDILIKCQKLIRSEIMVKVEGKRKIIIENWVNFLKKYRETFQDSLKQLKQCPTNGTILYNTQFHLINLLKELKSLTEFAESVLPLCQGSVFLPAIEHFTIIIKDVLRPLIPHEPNERLKHIYILHQALFSVAILLTVGNTIKNDQKIINNQELVDKIESALISLGNAYSNVHKIRQQLTIRPYSIPYFEQIKEQTIVLQRAIIDCKSITEMVTSITSDKTFQQALIFSKKKVDIFITLLNEIKIDPYHVIPTKKQIKTLIDALNETITKFLSYEEQNNDSKANELYKQIKDKILELKTITTIFNLELKQSTRAIFVSINRTLSILKEIMSPIRELSTILSDASNIYYFNNINRIIEEILSNHIATTKELNKIFEELTTNIKNVSNLTNDSSKLLKDLTYINESQNIDREIETFQEMRKILSDSQDKTQPNEEKFTKIQNVIDQIDLIISCINQLPEYETIKPPTLTIIPFFSGKEIKLMVEDIIPQFEEVSRFFNDFANIEIFSKHKNILMNMKYWKLYFDNMSKVIKEVKSNESQLLSKLKEVFRKKEQVKSPLLKEEINKIIPSSIELLQQNTMKQLNEQFNTLTNQLQEQINSFITLITNDDINSIITKEFPIYETLFKLSTIIKQTTNIEYLPYEPELANKLPSKIKMPRLTNDSSNLNTQEICKETINIINETKEIIQKFSLFIQTSPENSEIVEKITKIYEQIDLTLINTLKTSLSSVNLQNKMNLSKAANSLCNNCDLMNKSLKSKCHSNPNWRIQFDSSTQSILEDLDLILTLCDEAITFANNEDATLGELRDKIFAVSKPLQEQYTIINERINEIKQNIPSATREFTITLLNLCSSGASAYINLLLYTKDHLKDVKDLNGLLEKGNKIIDFIKEINDVIQNGLPTLNKLIEFSKKLNEIFGESVKNIDFENVTNEITQMKEQLNIINGGFEKLCETMEKSKNSASSGKGINLAAARDHLMKRLQLESRVHLCRWKMEYLEEKMKGIEQNSE
ncbi:hypothetical protein GPJ56_004754 [Histomonas meleagridis]|uniref:uncharacterized protein n=1 Tax=Histomonas meleagridis TaxID=135588 RepID=UPI00355A1E6D|nr:hypothetical protein GPJ56_004754 [Histomonas meleagridis]KAH0801652.1 hypothetical protein GO595_005487 [Histomonas meleagridis]